MQIEKVEDAILSIERVKHAIDISVNAGLEFSNESFSNIADTVDTIYNTLGKEKPDAVTLSTESFNQETINYADVANQYLDAHLVSLSTESNGLFDRFKKALGDVFGKELDGVARTKERAVSLLKTVESKESYGRSEKVEVKNSYSILVGGRINPLETMKRLSALNKQFFNDGRFLDDYMNQVNNISRKLASGAYSGYVANGDSEKAAKEYYRVVRIEIPKPFKLNNRTTTDVQRDYTYEVSDKVSLSITVPNRDKGIVPTYMRVRGWDVRPTKMEVACTQQQAVNILQAAIDALDGLPSDKEIKSIIKNYSKDVKEIVENNPTARSIEAKLVERAREDSKQRNVSALTYVLGVMLLFPTGPIGPLILGIYKHRKINRDAEAAKVKNRLSIYAYVTYRNAYMVNRGAVEAAIDYVYKSK